MNHLEPNRLWSKVKTSTKSITTSIGNISLRTTEHDGDSPETTLIHKALVNYYAEQGQGFPQWLGHIEDKKQQPSATHQHHSPQQMLHSAQPNIAQRYRRQNSFRDMYEQNSTATPVQPAGQTDYHHAQSLPARQEHSDAVPSGHSARNAMKDRLKRNNYRNNFGSGP